MDKFSGTNTLTNTLKVYILKLFIFSLIMSKNTASANPPPLKKIIIKKIIIMIEFCKSSMKSSKLTEGQTKTTKNAASNLIAV